jgi:hypothetical protein
MTTQIGLPCVLLCTGKDCRRLDAFEKLRAGLLEAGIRLEEVPCLGVCDGPVAAVAQNDEVQIAIRLRSKKKRNRVVQGATESPKQLDAVAAKGKKAKRARRRAVRRLERLGERKAS